MNYLVDSHSHLHQPWFDNLDDVIDRARQHNVRKIINCASDPDNFAQVLESSKYDNISVTLGIQPTLTDKYSDATPIREIENISDKIVAIGEVGLDYYWIKEEKKRKAQESLLIDCLELADELNLPVVIHTRKAETESLNILEKYAKTPVLLHSFDGNLKQIERAKDLGYLITVPTIVTRRKNRRKVTQRAGLDNIMIETDSPFCTTDEDIERNEPMYIAQAARYIAKLLDTDLSDVQSVTTKNAISFHNL